MKVLAINGSPRKGGNTELLLEAAKASRAPYPVLRSGEGS